MFEMNDICHLGKPTVRENCDMEGMKEQGKVTTDM
jgi:hypothetical protein